MCVMVNETMVDRRLKSSVFDSKFHQLSHELRTPLNHINGFAELLLTDDSLSPTHADYVRAILNGSMALQAAVISYLDGRHDAVQLAIAS